ncbi:MAG: hypothetical protein ACLTSK_00955 [Christensenellales bacterium]
MKKPSDNTFAYIARNFFFLLPIVALPVVLLTVFQREGLSICWRKWQRRRLRRPRLSSPTFSDLYAKVSIINFDRFADWNVSKVWFWLVTAIVVMLGFSLTVAHIERHMRLGVKEPFKWMSMMKSGAYNAFFYSLIMLVFYELCMVALSSFILLNSRIMNGWWAFGMSVLATVVIYAVFIVGFCFLLLTVPSMFCDGYRFGFAASYSIHLVAQHFKRFVGVFALTACLSGLALQLLKLVMMLLSGNIPIHILLYAIRALNYLWWLLFVPTYAIRNYIDYTEASRKDLKTLIFD